MSDYLSPLNEPVSTETIKAASLGEALAFARRQAGADMGFHTNVTRALNTTDSFRQRAKATRDEGWHIATDQRVFGIGRNTILVGDLIASEADRQTVAFTVLSGDLEAENGNFTVFDDQIDVADRLAHYRSLANSGSSFGQFLNKARLVGKKRDSDFIVTEEPADRVKSYLAEDLRKRLGEKVPLTKQPGAVFEYGQAIAHIVRAAHAEGYVLPQGFIDRLVVSRDDVRQIPRTEGVAEGQFATSRLLNRLTLYNCFDIEQSTDSAAQAQNWQELGKFLGEIATNHREGLALTSVEEQLAQLAQGEVEAEAFENLLAKGYRYTKIIEASQVKPDPLNIFREINSSEVPDFDFVDWMRVTRPDVFSRHMSYQVAWEYLRRQREVDPISTLRRHEQASVDKAMDRLDEERQARIRVELTREVEALTSEVTREKIRQTMTDFISDSRMLDQGLRTSTTAFVRQSAVQGRWLEHMARQEFAFGLGDELPRLEKIGMTLAAHALTNGRESVSDTDQQGIDVSQRLAQVAFFRNVAATWMEAAETPETWQRFIASQQHRIQIDLMKSAMQGDAEDLSDERRTLETSQQDLSLAMEALRGKMNQAQQDQERRDGLYQDLEALNEAIAAAEVRAEIETAEDEYAGVVELLASDEVRRQAGERVRSLSIGYEELRQYLDDERYFDPRKGGRFDYAEAARIPGVELALHQLLRGSGLELSLSVQQLEKPFILRDLAHLAGEIDGLRTKPYRDLAGSQWVDDSQLAQMAFSRANQQSTDLIESYQQVIGRLQSEVATLHKRTDDPTEWEAFVREQVETHAGEQTEEGKWLISLRDSLKARQSLERPDVSDDLGVMRAQRARLERDLGQTPHWTQEQVQDMEKNMKELMERIAANQDMIQKIERQMAERSGAGEVAVGAVEEYLIAHLKVERGGNPALSMLDENIQDAEVIAERIKDPRSIDPAKFTKEKEHYIRIIEQAEAFLAQEGGYTALLSEGYEELSATLHEQDRKLAKVGDEEVRRKAINLRDTFLENVRFERITGDQIDTMMTSRLGGYGGREVGLASFSSPVLDVTTEFTLEDMLLHSRLAPIEPRLAENFPVTIEGIRDNTYAARLAQRASAELAYFRQAREAVERAIAVHGNDHWYRAFPLMEEMARIRAERDVSYELSIQGFGAVVRPLLWEAYYERWTSSRPDIALNMSADEYIEMQLNRKRENAEKFEVDPNATITDEAIRRLAQQEGTTPDPPYERIYKVPRGSDVSKGELPRPGDELTTGLGAYVVIGYLGQGATSNVVLAKHVSGGHLDVIKIGVPPRSEDRIQRQFERDKTRGSFEKEQEVLTAIHAGDNNFEGVPEVKLLSDWGEDYPYIVMEYISPNKSLPVLEAIALARDSSVPFPLIGCTTEVLTDYARIMAYIHTQTHFAATDRKLGDLLWELGVGSKNGHVMVLDWNAIGVGEVGRRKDVRQLGQFLYHLITNAVSPRVDVNHTMQMSWEPLRRIYDATEAPPERRKSMTEIHEELKELLAICKQSPDELSRGDFRALDLLRIQHPQIFFGNRELVERWLQGKEGTSDQSQIGTREAVQWVRKGLADTTTH